MSKMPLALRPVAGVHQHEEEKKRDTQFATTWFLTGAGFVFLCWLFFSDWPRTVSILTSGWFYAALAIAVIAKIPLRRRR